VLKGHAEKSCYAFSGLNQFMRTSLLVCTRLRQDVLGHSAA